MNQFWSTWSLPGLLFHLVMVMTANNKKTQKHSSLTPSVDALRWPLAGQDLQRWPLSDTLHSDERFLLGWNHDQSNTGFLVRKVEQVSGKQLSFIHHIMNFCRYQNDVLSLGVMILTSNPVDSNALDPADASSDDVLPPGLITFGAGDSV